MRRYEADLALPHPHVSEGVQQVAKVFILDYFTSLMIYLVTLHSGCCSCCCGGGCSWWPMTRGSTDNWYVDTVSYNSNKKLFTAPVWRLRGTTETVLNIKIPNPLLVESNSRSLPHTARTGRTRRGWSTAPGRRWSRGSLGPARTCRQHASHEPSDRDITSEESILLWHYHPSC